MRMKRVEGLAWQTVGTQTIVIDLRHGRSLGLNETGGLVWQMLPERDSDEIAAEVADRYAIPHDQAHSDVSAVLVALRDRGLVVEV